MTLGTGRPKQPSAAMVAQVLSVLSESSDWTTYGDLALWAGISPRSARLCVRILVQRGEPIVTDSVKGYRMVSDAAELRDAAGKLRHRATAIYQRAAALEATADRIEREDGTSKQPELCGWRMDGPPNVSPTGGPAWSPAIL